MASAVIPRPRKRPGPAVPPHWREHFVTALRKSGGLFTAAEAAGIDPTTVRRYRAVEPDFEQQIQDALDAKCDDRIALLDDIAMVNRNPLPLFFLVKERRPSYVDKNLLLSAVVDVNALDSNTGRELLAAMLGEMRPGAQRALHSSVVEVVPRPPTPPPVAPGLETAE